MRYIPASLRLVFIFLCCLFASLPAFSRTVRVGCFFDDILYEKQGDESNSSYLLEFLTTINRYNDWQFECVYIQFDEAAAALKSGKIDMLAFCGRGIAAEGDFLFSDIPSAVGSLALAGYHKSDMKNLRIGITDNAPPDLLVQIKHYAAQQGILYTTRSYKGQDGLLAGLKKGEIDVMATIDLGMPKDLQVVASIAPIFFYIGTLASQSELFLALNQALSLTFNLTPDFLNTLRLRYVPSADEGVFNFTYREQQFLGTNPLIRIAMPDNQKPYSYFEGGKRGGILAEQVKSIFSKSYLMYEVIPTKSYRDAVEAVRQGKADVVYAMANTLNNTDTESFKLSNGIFRQKNVVVTHPDGISPGSCSFVAVRAYQYLSSFVKDNYHADNFIWRNSAEECIQTVRSTKNSFTILPALEVKVYEQNHLFPGIKVLDDDSYTSTLCIGISKEQPPELCSILDKTIHRLSSSMMEDYLTENLPAGRGLQSLIKQHPFFFLGMLIAFVFILTTAIFFAIYNNTKRRKDKQIATAMNLANRDAMTGLYNHIAYEKLVEKTLSHQTADSKNALVMIDIDNFKRINDTLGHGTGDVVIVTLANVLLSVFRQGDLKCRMGGDEFSVFMKDVTGREGVEHKLTFLMQEIERVFSQMKLSVPVTCSVGAVICRGQCTNAFKELYAIADQALYTVKEGGKNSFAIAGEEVQGQDRPPEDFRERCRPSARTDDRPL